MKLRLFAILAGLLLARGSVLGNQPGGGNGTGPNVTLVNNGGTVTMGNGIVTIVCTASSATLTQINYTYNNSGTTVTNFLLQGGKNGGEFYWELGGFSSGSFTYSAVASTGDYAEFDLFATSATNGTVDIHFSMLRGSPGFYVTPIWSHRVGDSAMGTGEERDNIYINPEFAWNSIDATRNFQYNNGGSAVGVLGAPVECSLWTNGISQWRYEDKYKYSAIFGTERVWGWSSVNNPAAGFTGQNIGIWHVLASVEYYNGGPLKPELMDAPMVNMINGGHYQMGSDSNFGQDEQWTRVSGPYFIYCNNITNTITNTFLAASNLFADAQAQAAAEQTAWPYSWFTNASYTPASGRGTVTGQFDIADAFNPNASASGLWVGVVQQPATVDGVYDFQQWMKPYQFWVQADTNGNFAIPNVISGNNYTLYAFGPGAAGTFMSQNQSGGNPPILFNLPASPFAVTVTGGATNNLGTVTWTPTRVGPTVFEIGYPDRTARKFRHGEDWWVGDLGPVPGYPSPIWSKFLEYPFDFTNGGPNYVVGQSRWSTDWNFVQPIVVDSQGNDNPSTSTISFNLAQAPANGASASLYIGIASSDAGALIVSVNGNNLGTAAGVTATPVAEVSTGYFPAYSSSDTTIREFINAAFSDERLTFPASLLQAGQNTITINMRKGGYFANHSMYDYLRLEMTGFVPPPPARVTAFSGNNRNLVSWPAVPGASSYNILRTTTSGSGYTTVASNVTGPVCGSGLNNATWVDTNAVNGTTYYYVVQSVNPVNASTNSPESTGVSPSSGASVTPPPVPTGLTVSGVGHGAVSLAWNAAAGASYYTIRRSTLVDTLGGASNTLDTITLNNTNVSTTYTDNSPTDGGIYSYTVSAANAAGTSGDSAPAVGVPLPPPPASAPGSLTGHFTSVTNITLSWSAVPGAVGYVIYRGTSQPGPYSYVMSITETTYTDFNLNTNLSYYYQVASVNAGGISTNAVVLVLGPPAAPGLTAVPGNAQITLNWSAVPGATNYVLQTSTTNGGPYSTLLNTTNISFVHTNLLNGTNYYYVVYSQGPNGQSPLSNQATATPSVNAGGIFWTDTVTTSAQNWNANANWNTGTNFPNAVQDAAVVNSPISANQTINLNQAITVGSLSLGSGSGAFTIAANSGSLTFDNTPAQATLAELSATKGDTISAPMTVNGSLLVTNPSANALTLSGNITGGSLVISGNTTMSGTDSYTGGTTLNGGRLTFSVGTAIPSSGVLTLNNTGSVTVVTANGLPNVLANGTNSVTGNGNSGTGIGTLDVEGALTLFASGGSLVFDLTGPVTGAGSLALGSSPMTLRFNGTGGGSAAIFNLGSGTAVASVRNTATTGISLGGLTGGSGTQLQGDNSGGGANMTYTIGGANATTRFDGVIKNGTVGTVAVTKTGSGMLTLTATNTYTAGTAINGGTLQASNTLGSATGTGPVTVNSGGTLAGPGIISGAVTVNAGGTLAPGRPLGTLTLSNLLTLNAGSTTTVAVSHSPFTNSLVRVVGASVNEGGTLTASNSSAAAFVSGDHFTLLNATGFSGAYSGFNLPALNPGLAWDAARLNVDGSLWVVGTAPPSLGAARIAGNQLLINGTGGTPNWYYYVLSSTNPALPLVSWTRIATNQYDNAGNFVISNTINPALPATYLRLQQP